VAGKQLHPPSVAFEDGRLVMIDQTLLPGELSFLRIDTPEETAEAIKRLAVRGAMAIAVAGAYGVLLGAMRDDKDPSAGARAAAHLIDASRPTARNLFWALERMEKVTETDAGGDLVERLKAEADAIARDLPQTEQVRDFLDLLHQAARLGD